jgi:hypothetical protein
MFRIFILFALLFTAFDPSYAIAQDHCGDILKSGIYELNERYSEDETDDFVTNWICNITYEDYRYYRDFDINLGFKLLGIEGEISQEKFYNWKKKNCREHSNRTISRNTEKLYSKKISKPIIEAWLECMRFSRTSRDQGYQDSQGWNISPPVNVQDKHGKRATMRIVTLGYQYHWVINKNNEVADQNGQDVIMKDKFSRGSSWRRPARKAIDIIAVGTASCGFENRNLSKKQLKQIEIDRAQKRASQLMTWMEEYDFLDLSLYKQNRKRLNLGFYLTNGKACMEGSDTADKQRQLAVVLVMEKENITDSFDYESALQDAARQCPEFPTPENYSNFDIN